MQITAGDKTIKLDPSQNSVFKHLAHLQKQIVKLSQKNPTRLALKGLFVAQKPIQSLYIYGKVGRGKSMLMRNFFEHLPISNKIYFHFNSFMQEVHKELHKLRKHSAAVIPAPNRVEGKAPAGIQNLIFIATRNVVGKSKVVCFDEMQVEDVADAMILQGVFSYFVENQIAVVTTSNCHPLELYENGLQRDLFLKFVDEVLLKNFLVLNLDGKVDYRGQFIASKQHYFYPDNAENKKAILDLLLQVTENKTPCPQEIELLGRKLLVKNSYKNIALFDFKELCGADLGVADYQAICREFSLIFLLNVPVLKAEDRNEAKRLIWFIDEIYENKVGLLVLASCKPEEIYIKGIGAKAFKRTASRLSELATF
jgi:cell division protein ZapE